MATDSVAKCHSAHVGSPVMPELGISKWQPPMFELKREFFVVELIAVTLLA